MIKIFTVVILLLTNSCYANGPANGLDFGWWLQTEIDRKINTGGIITIDPGVYKYQHEPTITGLREHLTIQGPGAELQPQGAIAGIRIEEGLTRSSKLIIRDLVISQHDQPLGIAAIHMVGSKNIVIEDVHLSGNQNNSPDWCAIIIEPNGPDGNNYGMGPYWTRIVNSTIGPKYNPPVMPCGIRAHYANTLVISGNKFYAINGVAIHFSEKQRPSISHAVIIENNTFENNKNTPGGRAGHTLRIESDLVRVKVNGFSFTNNQIEGYGYMVVLGGKTKFDQRLKGFDFTNNQYDPNVIPIRNIWRSIIKM